MKSPGVVGGKPGKDPISVSIKERKDGGSILTQLPAKGGDMTDVYKLELKGKGAKTTQAGSPGRKKK